MRIKRRETRPGRLRSMDIASKKPLTLTHYEALVLTAVRTVTSNLDEALDLHELASPACMAPLHFHRVFRGLIGETPLQLHRRLRLERAAWQLAQADESVLRIALGTGYETHEAFTRAFKDSYGRAPTEYRALARAAENDATGAARAPTHRLQAACGIHVEGAAIRFPDALSHVFIHHGALAMKVQIESRPEIRVAALSHTGPYNTIGAAFERLATIAGPAGMLASPDAKMIAIYYDDPESTPAEKLRSAAGISVPSDAEPPQPLHEARLPAGRWASVLHRGSYAGLGDAWQRFLGQWLPNSGHQLGLGECYELYLNHPGNAREEDLETLLYAPVRG